MEHDTTARTEVPDETTPEGQYQPGLDFIIKHWIAIAALAWEGLMVHGPGAVILSIKDDGAHSSYRPGSPCACHPIDADSYDPREQVVLVIHREAALTTPVVVSGWPAPPMAYADATIEILGGTLQ